MKVAIPSAWLWLFAFVSLAACEDAFRSNGKGGGRWSDPTTWENGKLPTGGSISVLGKDVVALDTLPGNSLDCDALTIDPGGLLRLSNTNQSVLIIRKNLNVLGGLVVDLSKTPGASCEFRFLADGNFAPQVLFSERSKVLLKGAPTDGTNAPNVAFRFVFPTNHAAQANASLAVSIGKHTWFETESVVFERVPITIRDVDGSGVRFNERVSLRRCRFIRSPVSFQRCAKIDVEQNHAFEAADHGFIVEGCAGIRCLSNRVEKVRAYGIVVIGAEIESMGNIFLECGNGLHLSHGGVALVTGDVYERNRIGLLIHNPSRSVVNRCVFRDNTGFHLYASGDSPNPGRFYDCTFAGEPGGEPGAAAIMSKQKTLVDIVNTPRQKFVTEDDGAVAFSAYVDILVANDKGEPLGRVPLRVLEADKVVAISRTEAVGAQMGHTPLPSSHRPLVLPWFRYMPSKGETNSAPTRPYTVEADGTHLGYNKQTVSLVVDESFLRADPEKPSQTLKIQLSTR